MRPVFVGNLDNETRQSDLERLFRNYAIERIDMKSGFAFVHFKHEQDAEDVIRRFDNTLFGYEKRKISVEWGKGDRSRADRSVGNQRPTKTLFVINFDPIRTTKNDIYGHFDRYGKVLDVRVRKNYAFVRFATQEDATTAFESTQRSKLLDRDLIVDYALISDDERGEKHGSPRRGRSGRSPSPVFRSRPSNEYNPYNGPAYDRRRSPDYRERQSPQRSPSPVYRERPSPEYNPSNGPAYDSLRSPDYGRNRSPGYDRYRSSPRPGPEYNPSNGPAYDRRRSPDYGRNRSPGTGYHRYRRSRSRTRSRR